MNLVGEALKITATMLAKNPPMTWNTIYATPRGLEKRPVSFLKIKAKVMAGLKWEPDTLAAKMIRTKMPRRKPQRSYKTDSNDKG